ncbi:MAG TPA: putative Ig domain-containing protein [Planctomycetota bacterium]|nr:putative Ig domain-containing protein [Planctomycetota bacterium]
MRKLAVIASLVMLVAGCSGSSSNSTPTNTNPAFMSPSDGSTLPSATVGVVYTQTFTVVSGGTPPFTFQPTGLPPGFAFTTESTTSGALSGTPTQAGTGTFELNVLDAKNQVTTVDYALTIFNAAGSTITISPSTLPSGTHGMPYIENISAGSGTAPFTWTVSGNVPPGLQLGSSTATTTQITGNATTAGTYTFTVHVADSSNPQMSGTQSYTVTIN